jgi:hypothetical protein
MTTTTKNLKKEEDCKRVIDEMNALEGPYDANQ